MNKVILAALAAAAVVVPAVTGPALAQSATELPGRVDPSRVAAGRYTVDTDHTQVVFTANHFGFTDYVGLIGGATGTLTLDPAKPDTAKVTIDIPLKSVVTTSSKLNGHLQTADFFDTKKFPTATFESTEIAAEGNTARITGNLTLRGVTRPVVLDARFTGAGVNPMNKAATVGFSATTTIKRSDFGVSFGLPVVSDEVGLEIVAAFEKAN
ncbi:YceI family protein [Rhodovulum sp. PH10]|uniref:YceI family protein n=1 Tax=Rhodovulum sp. PH10 TaxID=1187851 RepID=UPI00027C2305|nr:YceI family protein [Rhodovulum sp. PH10]EJW13201.1 YceI family protein [Rhodovulum sp. PH10]